MSNQHTPEPNNLEATVFIYRHKRTGKTQAHYIDIAQMLEDDQEWEHLGTVEPRMWIEHHYEAVEQRAELLATQARTCTWSLDDDDYGTWSGSCGALWCFIDGGPEENSMNFCPQCGGKVVIASVKGGAA